MVTEASAFGSLSTSLFSGVDLEKGRLTTPATDRDCSAAESVPEGGWLHARCLPPADDQSYAASLPQYVHTTPRGVNGAFKLAGVV